jgi:hypothetical protein
LRACPSGSYNASEEYIALITALQHNTTLKSLILQQDSTLLHLTDDEDKQMAVLLKKNYALERLRDIKQGRCGRHLATE